jgi:peptide deformylase
MRRNGVDSRSERVLKLTYYPDPILLKKASPVTRVDDDVRAKVAGMIPLMELERGIGLAAPQVGWDARVLLAKPDGDEEAPVVLVNPKIVKKSGSEWGEEGCLSFPGIYGEVLRATKIVVEATDLDMRPIVLEAEDLFARVLQHEIDHLDGILFTTKMRATDRKAAQKKLDELRERYAAAPPEGGVPAV